MERFSIWAYVVNRNDPFQYYADQLPAHTLSQEENFPGQALSVTLQLGNVFLLLAAMAVVCCFSPSSATAKWYLVAVAFADYVKLDQKFTRPATKTQPKVDLGKLPT